MAAKQMDAVSSFQHVVNNIPTWKKTIAELVNYAAKRHEEYAAEYVRLLHQARPKKKKKSESVSSIRSIDDQLDEPPIKPSGMTQPQPLNFVDLSPFEAGNRYLYAQAQRKRKPGTSMRSGPSESATFRSKQMVIIYYDSHIQIELDSVVRAFGIARNNLRKGKNDYTAANGFQLPMLTRRYDSSNGVHPISLPSFNPHPTKPQKDATAAAAIIAPSSETAFAKTDKEIEVIQNLCEHAAHQAIRDGDCKMELEMALKNMDSLLISAQKTLDNLIVELKQHKHEEVTGGSDVASDAAASTLCEADPPRSFTVPSKSITSLLESVEANKRPPVYTTTLGPILPSTPTSVEAIEVDEDDDDDELMDIQIDMSRFRSTIRGGVTS